MSLFSTVYVSRTLHLSGCAPVFYLSTGAPPISMHRYHFSGEKFAVLQCIQSRAVRWMVSCELLLLDSRLNINQSLLGTCCHFPSSFLGCLFSPDSWGYYLPAFLGSFTLCLSLHLDIWSVRPKDSYRNRVFSLQWPRSLYLGLRSKRVTWHPCLSKLAEHKRSMLCGHDAEFGAKMIWSQSASITLQVHD